MEKILEKLEKWRKERGLDRTQGFEFDLNTQMSFFFEEIGVEFLRAKTEEEKIDAYCDTIIFAINGSSLLGYIPIWLENANMSFKSILLKAYLMLDSETATEFDYSLIFTICKDNIIELGYDFNMCMDETLKEIESRTGAINSETGKWEKFKTDEAKAKWYKADFKKCKLKDNK